MFDLIGTIKKKTGLDDLFGDGMSVPKSVQDVIKIDAVYSDGIFMTGKDRYSKTFKFTDINYAVSSKEDKEANFLRYSEILNSLENGISSQITIINRKLKKAELEEIALLEKANDDKDKYRKEINDMLTMIANGANAIVQDKYVTLTIQKKSVQEAQKFGEKQALGIETNIANYQRKQNANNNYTSVKAGASDCRLWFNRIFNGTTLSF